MKQLNFKDLKVGQKVWSIQLGYCEVVRTDYTARYPLGLKNKKGVTEYYTDNLLWNDDDYFQSVFESNPFETTQETPKEPENKVELMKVLFYISNLQGDNHTELASIATEKLKQILESL